MLSAGWEQNLEAREWQGATTDWERTRRMMWHLWLSRWTSAHGNEDIVFSAIPHHERTGFGIYVSERLTWAVRTESFILNQPNSQRIRPEECMKGWMIPWGRLYMICRWLEDAWLLVHISLVFVLKALIDACLSDEQNAMYYQYCPTSSSAWKGFLSCITERQ